MQITDLDYLENTPLSTQLSRLTGDGWHIGNYVNETGKDASCTPSNIIKNVRTGQLFRMPKKQSKIINYLYESWEFKMRLVHTDDLIQISMDTLEFLLCSVPPVRGGWSAFLAGEAMTHVNGRAVYACCFEVDEKYFLTFSNVQDFESKKYLEKLEKHLTSHDLF